MQIEAHLQDGQQLIGPPGCVKLREEQILPSSAGSIDRSGASASGCPDRHLGHDCDGDTVD